MTTSIIDYIFRELAISYLGRHELAHVTPEDVRGDAMHEDEEEEEPEFESEEVVSERVVDPPQAINPAPVPRSTHVHPLPLHGNGNGHKNGNGNGHKNGTAAATMVGKKEESARVARLKGYEGDPCPDCGQLTLVRSGACCKCDSCGATSGCS
jgi:ribonucleoside-diphosphate reductase alpha chain